MQTVTRLFDIIYYQKEKYQQNDSFSGKVNGEWRNYSTQDVIDAANKVSLSLLKLGVMPGDKIVIVANNRPEWNIADIGILQAGAVTVPVYPTISEHEYKFIFNDAEIKYVFVSDKNLFTKITNIKKDIPTLKEIFSFDKVEGCKSFSDFLEIGTGGDMQAVEAIKASIRPESLATIIYTSGTTGNPKGVMLSHNNIVSNIMSVAPMLPLNEKQCVLSFLPLCHIFERVVVYVYIYYGVSVYYAESMDTIPDNLKEVKPNFFTTVPRLLEKIYIKLESAGGNLTGIKKSLYEAALDFAKNYDVSKPLGMVDSMKKALFDKLIFSKWREALGGQCEFICSGAAALNPLLARVFTCAGIPIMEGYGQTETSPVVTVNPFELDRICFGTVGIPIKDVEVKLEHREGMGDGEGEICVKGPNVMMGYYKRPDLTAEVIVDGWLKTGDVGTWKEYKGAKYLKITDRVKELFKTSGDKSGTPYMAFQDLSDSIGKITVMKFNGTGWVNVGLPRFSYAAANYISLAVDSATGTPFVAYEDFGNPNGGLTVRKFNGSSWDTVGASNLTGADANYISMAVFNDTPYVAFEDFANDSKLSVVKFNGTAWVIVGSAGFSADETEYVSMAIDHAGKLYVAYQDRNTYLDQATVMTFKDTSWIPVGPVGFTPSGAAYASMAIDNHNTPYIAFSDDVASSVNSASVMKFDSGNWVFVGSEGFTNGEADYISIAFNQNGNPCIVYSDAANSGKATVMNFNGSNWALTSNKDFSSSQADYTGIAIDNNGIVYAGYIDYGYSYAASVMKFNPATGISETIPAESISAFPNPGSGVFSIKMQTVQNEEVQLSVYDLVGKLIWQNSPIAINGQSTTNIDLSGVATGMYLLQIKTSSDIKTLKLELQK